MGFADELARAACRSTTSASARTSIRSPSATSSPHLTRVRPRVLHTHLVHADVYGQLAGRWLGCPSGSRTKHGFNAFREGRWFGRADRTVGSLAHVHIAISRGLAAVPRRDRGLRRGELRDRPLRDRAERDATPYAGAEPRLAVHRPPDPDQGHLVAAACGRAGARRGARPDARRRGSWAARARAEGATRASSGSTDAVRFLGFVSPVQCGDRGRRHRRRSLARRGVRDGGARGDGASAPGDRERGGRPPRDRRGRRDRPRRALGGRRGARRRDRRARRRPLRAPPRWGAPAATERSPSSRRSGASSGSRSSTARARACRVAALAGPAAQTAPIPAAASIATRKSHGTR